MEPNGAPRAWSVSAHAPADLDAAVPAEIGRSSRVDDVVRLDAIREPVLPIEPGLVLLRRMQRYNRGVENGSVERIPGGDDVSETPVKDFVRERVLEHRDELAAARPAGYVHGFSSKIPPGDRDEIIRRRRAGETPKQIAADYNCHPSTVSRAVRARLVELGQYHPLEFHAAKRRRRAEAWEHMREIWGERDRRSREARQAAEELQARLEAADKEQRRLRARGFHERQQARALAAQGLPQ
jgi:Helix-turn-helix domain